MVRYSWEAKMNLGDKIRAFDDMLPANVKQLEHLFKIKVSSDFDQDELVEILEPEIGGLRKVLIGDKETLINLNPTLDGTAQDSIYSNRLVYRYIAKDYNGNFLAEEYSIKSLSVILNITQPTINAIMKRGKEIVKNTGGRKRKPIIIERFKLEK
jgi:hypothetical protein